MFKIRPLRIDGKDVTFLTVPTDSTAQIREEFYESIIGFFELIIGSNKISTAIYTGRSSKR